MSIRNNTLSPNTLKQAAWYAAAFGAAAGLTAEADAQVLYGDPEDITILNTGETVEGEFNFEPIPFDLDQDGDAEFLLGHVNGDVGATARSWFITEVEDANPDTEELEPAGDYLSNVVSQLFPFGDPPTFYPYFAPLSAGYVIPTDVGLDYEFVPDFLELGVTTFTYATSNPVSFPTEEDAYIGIEFTLNADTEPTVHYGWMRVQLLSGSQGFIVKDYGFNATPEGPIEVGEIGEPIQISNEGSDIAQGYAVRTVGANPFGDAGTHLQVQVAQAEDVRIDVYNVLGQQVETLHTGALAGQKTIQFGQGYAAGLYVVRVTGESFQQTLKVTRN